MALFRPFLLFFLVSVPLSASDEQWTPARIPAAGVAPFILYYQQFLRANPFAIQAEPRTPEDKAENRRRHQKAAEMYAAMAEVANTLSQSKDLPPTAPPSIKKEESKRISGTWNLFPHVPLNAADLRLESQYMRYWALSHETSLDQQKISTMHDFVAGLEESADPKSLFQTLKRAVCSRALSHVYSPINAHLKKPETPLPGESELGKKLITAVLWFTPFVQKYPNEENLEHVEQFLDTIELFREHYPDSAHTVQCIEQFRAVFTDIQKRNVEPIIKEYAETYEGVLRRRELLGKPMPIWGADLAEKVIDAKELEGKVVLLDFWATWCGLCIAEFPHLKLLYQKYKDKGFEIVSFSVDSEQDKLQEYLAGNPLPWRVFSKETTEKAGLPPLSRYYGAKLLPVVLLRDRSGKAVLLDARGQKLDEMLERLFEVNQR